MATAKWSIVGVAAALCSVASAQDDRDKMLEATYAQVKAARKLMSEGKDAEAERILLLAKQTHDQLNASYVSGAAYLAYLYLLQGRNDEAIRAMIFKPGRHILHSHLAAVAYARLQNRSRSRFMLVMPLESDEYLKQTFGGRENLPADEALEGCEALAWLLLAGQSSIGERFIRAKAAEEAYRLAPENPAVSIGWASA